MGGVVPNTFGGSGDGGGGEPAPAPVPPKPAVRPGAVVNVGDKGKEKSSAKRKIRRGAYRQRVPATVMGQEPTTRKTLLGQ
tara:strand:+ start:387 stop:629 length:243 start_codon:yes stop_codon:yes gene_type:complete